MVANGADIYEKHNNRCTALALAKRAGQKKVVELLREHGAAA
jgi:hypothetical protein